MLVDLARNDLGRVCEIGSVAGARATPRSRSSRTSSTSSPRSAAACASGPDAADALAACFPAGTLTGAPKIRAMELIDELEAARRGVYGGAVGYFDAAGQLRPRDRDPHGRRRERALARSRPAPGIVADSVPEKEYAEAESKAAALFRVDRARPGVVPGDRMIFIVDNYDSFTYNLVQAVGKLDRDVVVARNDRFEPEEAVARAGRARS